VPNLERQDWDCGGGSQPRRESTFQRSSRPQKDGESACNQEVEAGAALSALVDRVDLTETGIRVSLKLPIPETASRPAADANDLIVARFFPMTVRRRGVEMRLVIKGNGAPACEPIRRS